MNFVAPKITHVIGSKKACHFGALVFISMLILFGLLPKYLDTKETLGPALTATRFLSGLGGGLMNTTMLMLMNSVAQQMGQAALGAAFTETAVGVGGIFG